MIKQDDRTEEQKKSHVWGVVAKDKFMTGWGHAANGASRCAWAYETHGQARKGLEWVEGRKEMRYVSLVDLRTYRAPRGTAHFHVYVANSDHASLQ